MKRSITGGVYLVVDPSEGIDSTLPKIRKAIEGGLDIIQVWNNWSENHDRVSFINSLCKEAHDHNIPVLINEEWTLINQCELDGVHFDTIPGDLSSIRENIKREIIWGITCGNDLERIRWADSNEFDYISFCSMFPSLSAGVCEIVSKEAVRQARQITSLPIFVAGGITIENVEELKDTGMNGIALISAIMKADDPQQTTTIFKRKLNKIITDATIIS
jgi:thiamine-phosphate pyrophosphorylase